MSIGLGPIIVIILRLIAPFYIFKKPLLGGLICMTLDALDVIIVAIIGGTMDGYYHNLDKVLDTYYLYFEFLVSFDWENKLAKKTSIFLFAYRVTGVILYEITK